MVLFLKEQLQNFQLFQILAEEPSKNLCVKTILEGAIPPQECGCNMGTKVLGEIDGKCTESCRSASKETAECCENKCITQSVMVDDKINKEALAEFFAPQGNTTNLQKVMQCDRFGEMMTMLKRLSLIIFDSIPVQANPSNKMICGVSANHANMITCTAWLILGECERVKETEKCIALKKTAELCVDFLEKEASKTN